MVLWILAIVAVIAIPIYISKILLKNTNNTSNIDYIARFSPRFYGGFKEIGMCESCYVTIYDEYLEIQLWNDDTNKFYAEKIIKKDDIIDIRVQTQTQIQTQISLGKLFVFGVLAFGMKGNENTIVDEYVVMRVKYDGENINLILKIPNEQINFIQAINSIR